MTTYPPGAMKWLLTSLFAALLTACVPVQAPAPQQTPILLATAAAPLPMPAAANSQVSGELPSPNGEWTASYMAVFPPYSEDILPPNREYYQRLVVHAADGGPRYVAVDTWSTLLLGYTVPIPLQWSADSTRLYYTNRPTPGGCGILVNGSDLYQIDVVNGTQRQLLAQTAGIIGLAPDETHVAYQLYQPHGVRALAIQNLATGTIRTINMEAMTADGSFGALTWSPDSRTLAFVVAHLPCSGGWAQSTSIYTLDRASLALTPHLARDTRLLMPARWLADDLLLLETAEGEQYTMGLTDNQVSPIQPDN